MTYELMIIVLWNDAMIIVIGTHVHSRNEWQTTCPQQHIVFTFLNFFLLKIWLQDLEN